MYSVVCVCFDKSRVQADAGSKRRLQTLRGQVVELSKATNMLHHQ